MSKPSSRITRRVALGRSPCLKRHPMRRYWRQARRIGSSPDGRICSALGNPYGAQRHEQEWFECLEDAQKAIEGWKVKFPWNTYRLAKVIAVHEASAERANPTA